MLSVATDTVMRGRLVAAGRIVLDSWFEGDVVCSRLDLGSNGYVLGAVVASEVYIEGQIVGPVLGGRVHVMPGGFVEGDIRYVTLEVASGATHCGRCTKLASYRDPPELVALAERAAAEASQLRQIERTAIRRPVRVVTVPPSRLVLPVREATR